MSSERKFAGAVGSTVNNAPWTCLHHRIRSRAPTVTRMPQTLATTATRVALAGESYHLSLQLQGISFHVQALGDGSQQGLTITTQGAKPPIQPIQRSVDLGPRPLPSPRPAGAESGCGGPCGKRAVP